jgi:hypothetical protein
VVVFAVGALCIALLDRLLEPREPAPAPGGSAAPWPARPRRAIAVWVGAAALASLIPRYPPPIAATPRALLPESAPPWRSEREPEVDRLFLGSVHFTRSAQRRYVASPAPFGTVSSARQAARAEAFVGEDARRTRSSHLLSRKHRVVGRGWIVEEVRPETFAGGMRGERVVARSEGRRVLSWVWYVGVDGVWVETLRSLLALDQSPFHLTRSAYVVRLSTELGAGEPDLPRADRRLRSLARSLGANLPSSPR